MSSTPAETLASLHYAIKSMQHVATSGVPGMLAHDERKLLYILAKDYFCGRGLIVDAGAFMGASAASLASGIFANPSLGPRREPAVHSYDMFISDESTAPFIARHCGVDRPPGTRFRDLYQRNTEPYKSAIRVHDGDFLTFTWSHEDIEILFVDICKSRALNSHCIEQFFPYLIPGKSVIIHQDYHHPHLPWIHVTMEYLSPWMQIVVERMADSIVFLARDRAPQDALARCIAFDFPADLQLDLMDRAISRLSHYNRAIIELARVILLHQLRGRVEAQQALDLVARSYAASDNQNWHMYLEQTRHRVG